MKKLLLPIFLVLSGCDQSPQPATIPAPVSSDFGRFTVSQVASFHDSDAYNDTRKIFLLNDKQTGAEYVGISGVGISEVGSHRSGKSSIQDER